MNNLNIVLLIELVFWVFELMVSDYVVINPSFLAISVIFGSTILGAIGNIFWQVEISSEINYVILFGMIALVGADLFAKIFTPKKKMAAAMPLVEIHLNRTKENIVLIAVVACTALYCLDILRAGAAMGRGGLSAIYAVKLDNSRTNSIIRQGVKLVMAAMFIHTYIFVNNVLVTKGKRWNSYKHCIPAICAIICCIFTSVRTEILRVITALMVDLCVILFQRYGWKGRNLAPFFKKVIPFLGLGVVLLVALKSVVKGDNNATSNTFGALMYILYYLGTPIVVLGYKMSDGLYKYKGNVWGEMTFNRFYGELQEKGFLSNIHLQDGSKNVWIDKSSRITANVDTIFGPPMIDFGIFGTLIYIFLLFFALNFYYYRFIYKTKQSLRQSTKVITFSFLAAIATMAYYTNYFNQYLTIYFLLTLVLIKLMERFYRMNR